MKLVKPYMNEDKQIIFVEIENEKVHEIVNGIIFGFVVTTILFLIWFYPSYLYFS